MKRIKLLILTSDIPYPLSMGGNIAQFGFSDYLRHEINITYIFPIYNMSDKNNVDELRERWHNVKIVEVYHPSYYNKERFVFFRRLLKFVEKKILFSSLQKNVNISQSNSIFETALWYLKPSFEGYVAAVNEAMRSVQPDLIQIEHSRCLSFAKLNTYGIPKVFIDHEIQFAMLSSAEKNTVSNDYTDYVINLTKNIEINLLKQFECVLTFSDRDRLRLIENGCTNVEAIPFPILNDFFRPFDEENFKIEKLVFVGGDFHFPNYDAIDWYSNNLGETIYKKFNLKLHVIGNWKKENVKKFSSDYIVFDGYVNDLYSFTKNSIHIVPLRMGGGIRTKILNSLAYSQLVITTEIGIEGIDIIDGKHAVIFKNKTTLLDAIALMLDDKEKSIQMCKDGYEFVFANYSQCILASKRLECFKRLLSEKSHF